jgi:hypothetical protein
LLRFKNDFEITLKIIYIFLIIFSVIILDNRYYAADEKDIIADIDELISLGNRAPKGLIESIQDRIEKDSSGLTSSLLPRLIDANVSEAQLAGYVWALGIARDARSVDAIIKLAEQSKSTIIKEYCLVALATIGGKKSGDFLISMLNKTSDKNMRFGILNLLGQMQYELALVKTEEILKQDLRQYYWRSMFIFGKMGDKAVPFLLTKTQSKDRNIRANAIYILGQWLIAVEAAQPLREHYWNETDLEIRLIILSSLEKVTTDISLIKKFSEEIVSKEKNKSLVKFAQKTLNNMEMMEEKINSFKKEKKVSPKEFQEEYYKLYKSEGKEGDYKILSRASSFEDEPMLKKLRERILQRDSDESFYDYRRVNNIIMLNRFLKNKWKK